MKEIWKQIEGYEGLYEVSNLGRVKSLPKINNKNPVYRASRILKKSIHKSGYQFSFLYKNGTKKQIKTHRLVAKAFVKNPENKPYVNHKDGVKLNNFRENLEWVTHAENMQHARKTGLSTADHFKKRVAQILNGKIIKVWNSQVEAARHFGIHGNSISACCCGKVKTSAGFNWKLS